MDCWVSYPVFFSHLFWNVAVYLQLQYNNFTLTQLCNLLGHSVTIRTLAHVIACTRTLTHSLYRPIFLYIFLYHISLNVFLSQVSHITQCVLVTSITYHSMCSCHTYHISLNVFLSQVSHTTQCVLVTSITYHSMCWLI